MQTKKLILAPHTIGRYEVKLDTYFFFNAQSCNFWETDKITGSVVASLDGTLSFEDIISLLHENNPNVQACELKEHFGKIFEFLLKEGYICENI